jgi:hypothetical protein
MESDLGEPRASLFSQIGGNGGAVGRIFRLQMPQQESLQKCHQAIAAAPFRSDHVPDEIDNPPRCFRLLPPTPPRS